MESTKLLDCLRKINVGFFVGVPDSQLKALCDNLANECVSPKEYLIAANEGNAVGVAAGFYMATGRYPCVFMQNSGLGNSVNPIASLLNPAVYGIPVVFIIGWRGEPGVKDEPQHIFQGGITLQMLENLDITTFIIDKQTTVERVEMALQDFLSLLKQGKSVAFVVKKDALEYCQKPLYTNCYRYTREEALKIILKYAESDLIISTTGKTSREVFEIREQEGQTHARDFLTVGSMGHSSSIALGIALHSDKRVWCIDGDGSALMHMGALAIMGVWGSTNLVHVVLNNASHESVGGMSTVGDQIDFIAVATACGYSKCYRASNQADLEEAVRSIKSDSGTVFLEVKVAIGSRPDLGRPTTSSQENLKKFVDYLRGGRL